VQHFHDFERPEMNKCDLGRQREDKTSEILHERLQIVKFASEEQNLIENT
jgi:hypothetical protein